MGSDSEDAPAGSLISDSISLSSALDRFRRSSRKFWISVAVNNSRCEVRAKNSSISLCQFAINSGVISFVITNDLSDLGCGVTHKRWWQ